MKVALPAGRAAVRAHRRLLARQGEVVGTSPLIAGTNPAYGRATTASSQARANYKPWPPASPQPIHSGLALSSQAGASTTPVPASSSRPSPCSLVGLWTRSRQPLCSAHRERRLRGGRALAEARSEVRAAPCRGVLPLPLGSRGRSLAPCRHTDSAGVHVALLSGTCLHLLLTKAREGGHGIAHFTEGKLRLAQLVNGCLGQAHSPVLTPRAASPATTCFLRVASQSEPLGSPGTPYASSYRDSRGPGGPQQHGSPAWGRHRAARGLGSPEMGQGRTADTGQGARPGRMRAGLARTGVWGERGANNLEGKCPLEQMPLRPWGLEPGSHTSGVQWEEEGPAVSNVRRGWGRLAGQCPPQKGRLTPGPAPGRVQQAARTCIRMPAPPSAAPMVQLCSAQRSPAPWPSWKLERGGA